LVLDVKGGEKEKGVDGLRGRSLPLGEKEDPLAFACMNTMNSLHYMFICILYLFTPHELSAIWACNNSKYLSVRLNLFKIGCDELVALNSYLLIYLWMWLMRLTNFEYWICVFFCLASIL
jgi:hypothetical protein